MMTYLIGYEAKSNKEWISSTSVDYLMYSGYVTLAAHWLQMEAVAQQKLKEGGTEEPEFYQVQVKGHLHFRSIESLVNSVR